MKIRRVIQNLFMEDRHKDARTRPVKCTEGLSLLTGLHLDPYWCSIFQSK